MIPVLEIKNNGIKNYLKNTVHWAHYDIAIQIFKNNKLTGIGLKNFRYESQKEIYQNKEILNYKFGPTTHPHQIHFELLSETGIIGYLSFLITFIIIAILNINSLKKKFDFFKLSGLFYLMVNLIPIIPSGSFFTTFSMGLFSINLVFLFDKEKLFKSKLKT